MADPHDKEHDETEHDKKVLAWAKPDEKRRAFLLGAGGAAGASVAAGAGFAPDAVAQKAPARNDQAQHAYDASSGHVQAPAGGYGAFFNEDDALTIAAYAERLMPGAPGIAGARDCGVLNYIDLALAGASPTLVAIWADT